MRKYIASALMLFVLAGCKKASPVISDNPFMITIDNPNAGEAWVDVIPETNDFYYYFGDVRKHTCDSLGTDGKFVQWVDGEVRKQAAVMGLTVREMLYKGAWKQEVTDLTPGAEYYAYAMPYDDNDNPTGHLTKVYFKAVEPTPSSIKFDVALEGSVIRIHPKDDCSDVYFWEYEYKSWVDSLYNDNIVDYYHDMVYLYKEYGFFPTMLSQGDDEEDMADYYDNLEVGDEFYLFASGYDGAVSSKIYSYCVIYRGKEQQGEVISLEESEQN